MSLCACGALPWVHLYGGGVGSATRAIGATSVTGAVVEHPVSTAANPTIMSLVMMRTVRLGFASVER